MQIVFKGHHTTEEAAESMVGILKLFKERYGIQNFRQIFLDVTLLNQQGEDVELVDATTSEVLGVFEIQKSMPFDAPSFEKPKSKSKPALPSKKSHLRLVVDNTKKAK
ncbi:MAG: hypothetical protein JSS53_04010 [Proteobacteria bacterium]|nr:hypothetical protein [Pseudomonadota bacterium]